MRHEGSRLGRSLNGVLIGTNWRKFFARIGMFQRGCRFLTVWAKEDRVKAWKRMVRALMYEHSLTTAGLAAYLDRTPAEMNSILTRNTVEPPFGLVLDVCFVFDKDPLIIFPELVWMRDMWMQEFKANVKAAQTALDESDIGTLRDILKALEVGSARWADPLLAAPCDELLMVRESDYTERYADLVWTQKAKNKTYRGYAHDEAAKLRQEIHEDVRRRRAIYEQQEIDRKQKNRTTTSSANK